VTFSALFWYLSLYAL